jgi:hypothetical protein
VHGMVLWDWVIQRATEKWCHPCCELIWWTSVLLPMDSYGAEYHRVWFFPREGAQFSYRFSSLSSWSFEPATEKTVRVYGSGDPWAEIGWSWIGAI